MSRDPRNEGATDAERDAWLREALRHAPDADASAPPGVRDAILRQARKATVAAAPADRGARPGPWTAWWAWLMQPSVAAGFASVMVATLVGVMWWGRPIDEPLREANLPDAQSPAAAPVVATPAPPAAPTATAAPTAPTAVQPPRPPSETSAQATPRPAAQAKVTSPNDAALRTEERAADKERRAARTQANESSRRETFSSDGPSGSLSQATPAPALPAATSPAPAVAAAAPAERQRANESAADGPRPSTRLEAADADTAAADARVAKAAPSPFPAQAGAAPPHAAERAQAPARDIGANAAPGAAATTLSRAARPATELAARPTAAPSPAARLRTAVASAPGAWSWQRDGGPERPMNDAVQAWLGQLDDATRARWQTTPAAAGNPLQTLRLLRDGRLHTTLHVEADAVRLEAAAQAGAAGTPQAPLQAATAAALAAALEQATR